MKPIDLPKLAAPAQRALQSAGITNLTQLTKVSEEELMQLHGMGRMRLQLCVKRSRQMDYLFVSRRK